MTFTLQKELGTFGERWGCLATCLINIKEDIHQSKLTADQLAETVGKWAMSQNVLICNYKNHDTLTPEPFGWNSDVNPEWHFYVMDTRRALGDIGVYKDLSEYKILKCRATGTPTHFVLKLQDGKRINPAPELQILEVIEERTI